ncbi:hypothetical protein [Streptomyces sp. NPDC000878]
MRRPQRIPGRAARPGRTPSGIDRLWDHFHIVDTIFRLYPTIGSAGPAIEAVAHLLAHDHLSGRDIGEIKEIRLALPAIAVGHGAAVTRPTDMASAQFSTAFSVALRLVRGHNRPEDYMDPALWTDPDLLSVVDKVVPYAMEFPPDAPFLSCRVDIALADGRVVSCPTPSGAYGDTPRTPTPKTPTSRPSSSTTSTASSAAPPRERSSSRSTVSNASTTWPS